jgi:hypothetical protein
MGIWEVEREYGMTPVFSPYDVSDHYVEMQSCSLLLLHLVSTTHDHTTMIEASKDERKEVIEGMRVWRGSSEMIQDIPEG